MYIHIHIYIYIFTYIHIYISINIYAHTCIYPIYAPYIYIWEGVYFYTPKTQKINYVSQPKIYYYVKNIHSIRLKPSKISTLAHPKNTILLHTRISYKIFIT